MEQTQKVGLKREQTDQFYTHETLAKSCFNEFLKYVKPNLDNDVFIEPSAGQGAFSDIMFQTCKNTFAFDIEPKRSNIEKQDFLTIDMNRWGNDCVHCLGNPPFGRQSTLAKQFIKQCAKVCSSISFILPKSFKKASFSKVFPSHFHLVYEQDCPVNSFIVDGKNYDVPCVFQIWVKKQHMRDMVIREDPVGFAYVKQNENPCFALRRVGIYAGKLSTDGIDTKSAQSHYFIRLEPHIDKNQFSESFNNLTFDGKDNTVGPRSISKQEFTTEMNKIIKIFNQASV